MFKWLLHVLHIFIGCHILFHIALVVAWWPRICVSQVCWRWNNRESPSTPHPYTNKSGQGTSNKNLTRIFLQLYEIENVTCGALGKLDQWIHHIYHRHQTRQHKLISNSKSNFRFFLAMGFLVTSMAIFVMGVLYSSNTQLVVPSIEIQCVLTLLRVLLPFVSRQVASIWNSIVHFDLVLVMHWSMEQG